MIELALVKDRETPCWERAGRTGAKTMRRNGNTSKTPRKAKKHVGFFKEDITMRVTRDFEYTMVDKIYRLCNREQYFTCGSNRQYDLMFSMAKMPETSTRDIAIMIYTCSDGKASLGRILNDLNEIMSEIEEDEAMCRMEEQKAEAQRAADEVFCG